VNVAPAVIGGDVSISDSNRSAMGDVDVVDAYAGGGEAAPPIMAATDAAVAGICREN